MMLRRLQITLICAIGLASYTQEAISLPTFNYRTHGVIGGLAVTAAVCTVFAISSAYNASWLAYDSNNEKEMLQQVVDANKMAQGLESKPGNAFLIKQHIEKIYQAQDGDDKEMLLKKLYLSNKGYSASFTALVGKIDAFIAHNSDKQIKPIQDLIAAIYTSIDDSMRIKQSQKAKAIALACVNSVLALGGGLGALFYSRIAQ